jgi:hypothetical protein
MRKITTAITAAALAFSMMAAAVPAAAVTGYDSAYAGESAFVNIVGGQTQNFQVFFANTGTTSWVKGTGTQVDLAACLEDKVTCNAQDASEATWNSGWLSAVRYASTSQTTTPPGSLGTFSYNILAPVGVAAGIYHFNGDVVLSSTGERIHPEGYFQDANTGVSAGAAQITSLSPTTGSNNGGTTVTIAGSGIVCNPTFPVVSFGGSNGVVTSCGATALTVTSPAHATGSVTVTVTNPGAGASNGLTYVFADTSKPSFTSFTISKFLITAQFSEPVCRAAAFASSDWAVQNVSAATPDTVTGDSIPTCNAARDNAVSTATLTLNTAMPNGAFVETTLNSIPLVGGTTNPSIVDVAGNPAAAPQSRQATATAPETTPPTLASASGAVGTTTLALTFSEPVQCSGTYNPVGNITLTDFNSATSDPVVTGYLAGSACGNSATTATATFKLTTNIAMPADRQYTVTVACNSGTDITDIVGNPLACPATVIFTTGAGDFTPPTIVDARVVNNLASSDFLEVGDSFSLTFSEAMNGCTTGVSPICSIEAQDQDGTSLSGGNRMQCGTNVSCSWNTAVTTVTVTVTVQLTPPALGSTGSGTTQGMQIPFNITALNGINDVAGNPPNVLGSADRLVDYE